MYYIQDEEVYYGDDQQHKELEMLAKSLPEANNSGDSSPEMTQAPYALKQGWMDGIFGCLRPMLSIIGKGSVNEINGNQGKQFTVFINFQGLFKFKLKKYWSIF